MPRVCTVVHAALAAKAALQMRAGRFLLISQLAFQSLALDCWGDGSTFRYDLCCACGNGYTNMSGRSACWTSTFKFEDCCTFYNAATTLPNVPCWQDAEGPKRRLELRLADQNWVFTQQLVAPYTNHNHELAPYVLWPSAFALAAWLLQSSASGLHSAQQPPVTLAGKRAVELGCGLALPSLAAALGGARVLATDLDHRAVALAEKAAVHNLPAWVRSHFAARALDFRDTAALTALGPVDLLLIAGQFYREELCEPLALAARMLCTQGCTLLMANWVGQQQVESTQWFLAALEKEAFELRELFDCSERGYVHPHAQYQCTMMVRMPSPRL